ncbi:efflux RND transporter permease subunit [bacterium]|nr:efflux RND transporter permease subunit [bacterium]
MSLAKFSVRNPQFVWIMTLLTVALGTFAFVTMPRSEDPAVQPAGASVIAIYPGGSPADMEELLVEPVEKVLNELEDIKALESEASDGLAVVEIEFESGSDPDKKYADVTQKVNAIRSALPDNLLGLEIIKWSISDVYVLQLALISDSASVAELETEAEAIQKRIERVPGIRTTALWALPERQVLVSIDLGRLARLRVPLNQVMAALQDANTNIPGGLVEMGTRRLSVKAVGAFRSLEDIRTTPVHSAAGKVIRLRDVADVAWGHADPDHLGRFNGRRAVFITANQKDDTNIYRIFGRLRAVIGESQSRLPAGMRLETVFDQSVSVKERVNGFLRNLLEGIFLVGLVLLLADSGRSALIVMLAIPLSCVAGILILDWTGYGLQQISIAGLVIALGMLVDDAIVVTDSISRFARSGKPGREAALLGTQQVAGAVTTATVTTLLAFMPIVLMRNITGDFIRSMPLTVIYALTVSLLVSLTVTPNLGVRFLDVNRENRVPPARRRLDRFIETRYRAALEKCLARPRRTVGIAALAFGVSLALFPLVGFSLFPKAEKPQLFVNIEMPAGTALSRTDAAARELERDLMAMPEVRNVTANVGHGNPRLYYNVFPERQKSSHAQLFVELKKYTPAGMERFVNGLRRRYAGFAGGRVQVKELEQGHPIEAPISVRVIGDRLETLESLSRDVEAVLRSDPDAVNVNNPLVSVKSDLQVRINRSKAGGLGVPVTEIQRTVRAGLAGIPVTQYRDAKGRAYDVTVRLPRSGMPSLSDFDRITVTSLSGAPIPLRHLAAVEMTASPLAIRHRGLERCVSVTADVARGASVDRVTKRIMKQLKAYSWPKGYRFGMGGEIESREEAFGGMEKAVLAAMFGVFAVLVFQFKSFIQPLIIFSALPLAVIGSVFALLVTGLTFSFSAFIGLTSLVGIVVKNSILLVDYTNLLRVEGMPLGRALQAAGERRFVPILLTAATTVGGLLPLTLTGGSFWAPMGWTIIGGLLTSTSLTLLVVPALYKLFAGRVGKMEHGSNG